MDAIMERNRLLLQRLGFKKYDDITNSSDHTERWYSPIGDHWVGDYSEEKCGKPPYRVYKSLRSETLEEQLAELGYAL